MIKYLDYILSGTSMPSNPIPKRTTLATFSDKARRNIFTASFSSRNMLKSMIELVVFLHEVVSIVSNQRRAIILTRLLHNSGKVCNHLYQAFLFLTQFNTGRKLCRNGNTCFFRFTENRLDTGIRVLDERSCITIEIDGSFGLNVIFLRASTFNMKYFNAPKPTMRAILSASSWSDHPACPILRKFP